MDDERDLPAPDLAELRARVLEDALGRSFRDGVPGPNVRRDTDGHMRIRRELMFAQLLAWEFADPGGPMGGDARLERLVIPALERAGGAMQGLGFKPGEAGPGAYFVLSAYARALRALAPHVDPRWLAARVGEGERLYRAAELALDRTPEYLNARALEAETCFGLHRLTGRPEYLARCRECLDALVERQYPCGAQPYHTGGWIWGRRPAQVYQFLSASLMLHLGKELGHGEAVAFVRRLMDYALLATTRRGECFVAVFEGLHKTATLSCAGRQWVCAAGLGDARFRGLARRAYAVYAEGLIDDPFERHENFRHEALVEALELGIRAAPDPAPFSPSPGTHVLPDISTIFVHEPRLDLAMTVLTGYSALAEADAGSVRLYALTPELTADPSSRNAGLDAVRTDWRRPSEQVACRVEVGRALLSGRGCTKWTVTGEAKGDPARDIHTRELLVTMTWERGTLVLEYETLRNSRPDPLPSRLVLLLFAYPRDRSARLVLPGLGDLAVPAAEAPEAFRAEAPVGPATFAAPDGSRLEIVPELCLASAITAMRPPRPPAPAGGADAMPGAALAKEGGLRLAFEGPNVLDRGRYVMRFIPAAQKEKA